jgi:hypothetical protein
MPIAMQLLDERAARMQAVGRGDHGLIIARLKKSRHNRSVYRRRPGAPLDIGEVAGLVVLAVIAIWGVWFGVQSLLTLWWPLNAAYLVAGLLVAIVSAAVARALLIR